MPQITEIKPQKNKKRFNIFLDGKFSFALPAEALVEAGLKINQEISEEEREKLAKGDEFIRVYDRVLKFFSFRPRSREELNEWFKEKQVGGETQKLIKDKLRLLNLLNDEDFAKWWIEQRLSFRPMGARLLEIELRQKGIDKELIAKLLNGYIAGDTELVMARKIVEKKMKSFGGLTEMKLRQKLSAVLARRGFSWETIEKVVDEIARKG